MNPNLEERELFGNAVGSTLVTALYARACAHKRFPAELPLTEWDDPQARQAWTRLSQIAEEHGQVLDELVLPERSNLIGTIHRSRVLDRVVRGFVSQHENSQVVSLGVGLCNRAARLADLETEWIGIDFPDVNALRRQVLPDDQVSLIDASITGSDWLDQIDTARPTIFVAEGLFMYLSTAEVTQLLNRIGDRFRLARVVADVHNSRVIGKNSSITRRTGARFTFGVSSPQAFAELAPGWSLVTFHDTMQTIGGGPAIAQRVFHALTGSYLYGVMIIEHRQGASAS